MTTHEFTCFVCKQDIVHTDKLSTGYDTDKDGNKTCYACCGKLDLEHMKREGRITLYLVCEPARNMELPQGRKTRGKVTNWLGSLSFSCHTSVGRHNIAGTRYDCWFRVPDDPYCWHGVTYGDNTQICHCKRTKEKVNR